ncbi:transposase [Seinonella peptonophila]|nr:transposase [Seinonella peptonophila]
MLPKRKTHMGRPPSPLRKVLNWIIYVLKTGVVWMDMPKNMVPTLHVGED